LAWSTDVDDVLQDVLVRAWQRIETFREEGTLEDWLVSLAFHRCRDYQRSMRRKLDHWFRYADQSSRQLLQETPLEGVESVRETSAWQQIQHAMHQLAASDRELLVMIYLEHWSHQQLADHLHISVDVLHVRLHRARNRLKKRIRTS
jgi:RNA polymerase sigma factor (sigma-70 family)